MPKLTHGQADNPEARMPLMDHIRELRSRLVKIIAGLLVGMIIGFIFFDQHTFSAFGRTITIPGLWDFLQRPYCEALSHQPEEGRCALYLFGVLEPFFLRMKVAFVVGLILSSPVWLYQIWAFVTPGLHRTERRYTLGFLGLGVPFFVAGAALAYFTLDKGLRLFLSFLPAAAELNLRANEYLTYVVVIVLIFGVSFELPLLATFLNFAGILTYERLRRWRRMIVFGVCVFAAIATPSQDPFTMLALSIPMVILFEIATLIAKIHDSRKAASSPYADLSDDEASPLDLDDVSTGDSESDALEPGTR